MIHPTRNEKSGMKRNWETKPTTGPTGFLNTLTMIPMSSWAPMLMELSSTITTMTKVQNLFQNGLFMMTKTGVVILVSFHLLSTQRERLL